MKAKLDGDQENNVAEKEENQPEGEGKQILEYPDYEANKEEDFYEGIVEHERGGDTLNSAGSHSELLMAGRQGRAETSRREHEVSSDEEDDTQDFDDSHDKVNNDDFLGDEEAWDRQSIASSAIFPSQKRDQFRDRAASGVRPKTQRSRPQQEEAVDKGRMPAPRAENTENANPIEDLVKERAGRHT